MSLNHVLYLSKKLLRARQLRIIPLSAFKYILLIMLLQLSHFFSPLYSSPPCTPLPPLLLHLSSCPWVMHISSLASPFTMLFLTSPCLYCTYQLYFSFPVPFPLFSPLSHPTDNTPYDVHFCKSVPVLAVCFVHFCFFKFGCW